MQESSDGGSAGVLWNTTDNPPSARVRDHISPTQSNHHEEEGRTELLLITDRPSVSHPQNVAESRHSGAPVLEQGHQPNPLTSTGLPRMFNLKDPEPDTLTSTGLNRRFKDPEVDTATFNTRRSDLVAPSLPMCDPSMQESSDGGSVSHTSYNPPSATGSDHVSPTQSNHHEEEGGRELLLITDRPSVGHPQNVAESRHSGTLVLEQGHLSDSLTSSGLTQMFKDPELDTATSDTRSHLVAPDLTTCGPILKLPLLESGPQQAKSELQLLEAELHVTQLAETSHRRAVINLRNEVEEKDYEIARLRQKLRQKDEQIAQRDRTIHKLRKEKHEDLPSIYEKFAEMDRSIRELKYQCEGKKRRSTETVGKGHILESHDCNGKQVIKTKGVTEDNR